MQTIKYAKSASRNPRPSIAHAFRNSENYKFGYIDSHRGEFVDCGKLVDDYGYSPRSLRNASLWAYGHEFGYCHLVHCKHEGDGYSAHIDESPTIETDELPEAYGFYLMQAKSCFAPDCGEPWYICSDVKGHGKIVSESVLKCNGDRNCIGEYVETEEYKEGEGFYRFTPAFPTREAALKFALAYIQMHELDLIEGYEYQSNFSGTGIVSTGPYGHMQEIAWADLRIVRKVAQ